ncbi:conserved hypothetical protein [Ricinus communis]|uniref:Syringolide-induced protein 14-1-1 n=1 Tax=Ricinus communis TaxID=3988 RepID=B9SXC1_RICCO|nr:conserved hypothetical protein [Ricinus communis]|eukprot:XP_002530640.1 uncharacterized protein At1g76070 [Ricinus communis]
MGKLQKSKSKISDLLPKAAGPVTFLSPPPSPARANSWKGLSSPRVSLIPKEIRRKARILSFDAREPTSPKVSCMGKIKNRKRNKNETKKWNNPTKLDMLVSSLSSSGAMILKIFKGKQEIEERDASDKSPTTIAERAVRASSSSQVKKFASGRGVLKDFDWKAHVAGAADAESNCPQDDKNQDKERDVETRTECISVEPRKEVNLWKKRAISPPRPLQL